MNIKIKKSNHYILNNDYKKIQLNINEFGYRHHNTLEIKLKKFINTHNISKYSSLKEKTEINLKTEIIKYLDNKINNNNLILSNSGDINILSIYRLFAKKNTKSIIFTPTYSQYNNIGYIELHKNINIPINFKSKITINTIIKQISNINFDNSICFICNPNNPTGAVWELKTLLYLFKTYQNTIFIIDETYIDFSKLYDNSIKSVVEYVNTYNNIIIMRSFSKAFGLAGLRLSYLISNPEIINNLGKLISHKDVIELSKYAGYLILKNIKYYKNQIHKMFTDKQKLINFCNNFNIKILNSKTNFLCINIGTNILKIIQIFNKHNILIKKFDNNTVLKYYIRITIQENIIEKVINILKNNLYLINTNKFNIGFIDGCFDGYHYGHIMSLYNAKLKSKTLICGIHTNEEIYNHKQKYPIFNYNNRLSILKHSIFIDKLIDNVPYNTDEIIIANNNANKFFHGSDSINKEPLLTLNNKNLLVTYPRTKYISSTGLLERINKYKENQINKIKYGNKKYLNILYYKIQTFIKHQNKDQNINLNSKIIIININFDLFNHIHIHILELIKEKYPDCYIYIDLISNQQKYIIYSIDEIKIILSGIKLINKIILSDDDLNNIKKINNNNFIQINTNILNNINIDTTFNNMINEYNIDNIINNK